VHDGVFGTPQEIRTSSKTIEHAAAHNTGGVCVRVDVDFDGGVHANDTETTDDLGAVTDLLGAQEEFGRVLVPVLVEALEAVGGEADGGRGCEVEVSGIEEVEEGVLEDFGPDFEVFEVCAAGLDVLATGRVRGFMENLRRGHQQQRWQCFRYQTGWATGSREGDRA
jgi:hypothetical protein